VTALDILGKGVQREPQVDGLLPLGAATFGELGVQVTHTFSHGGVNVPVVLLVRRVAGG
jgi:hypothetical protein